MIDKRAYRKQITAEEARKTAAAKLEQERVAELNRIEIEEKQLGLDDKKDERRDAIAAKKRSDRSDSANKRRQVAITLAKWVRKSVPSVGQTVLVTGPILSPMAVAWTSQTSFAVNTLGWPGPAGIVFAAAWEASTAFCGWMYHQARKDGDHGLSYKAATWVFAGAAGAMNYWHNCPVVIDKDAYGLKVGSHVSLDPTPKAVAYAVMSLSGIALWELYTSLKHKQFLRTRGVVSEARPKFGVVRWARYPRVTFTAWSESVRSRRTLTVDDAWSRAVSKIDAKRRARKAARTTDTRPSVRVSVVRVKSASVMTLPKARVKLFFSDTDGHTLMAGPVRSPHRRSDTIRPLLRPPVVSGQSPEALPAATQTDRHVSGQSLETLSAAAQSDRHVSDAPDTTGLTPTTSNNTPVTNDVRVRPTKADQNAAIKLYLDSVRSGAPLSKVRLASLTGFSPSWALNQMNKAKKILADEQQ